MSGRRSPLGWRRIVGGSSASIDTTVSPCPTGMRAVIGPSETAMSIGFLNPGPVRRSRREGTVAATEGPRKNSPTRLAPPDRDARRRTSVGPSPIQKNVPPRDCSMPFLLSIPISRTDGATRLNLRISQTGDDGPRGDAFRGPVRSILRGRDRSRSRREEVKRQNDWSRP